MPLGKKVGLGPGHIVLDGDLPAPQKGAHPPTFWPMFIVAISTTAEHLLVVLKSRKDLFW